MWYNYQMKAKSFIKIAILSMVFLLLLGCGSGKKQKVRVVILGFDGANWPTIDPLIEAGKLPFIKKLKEEAAWASFQTDKPTKSSVVWTSIATGKTMLKHGILDFTFLKRNKIEVPYSNVEKREPSLWQMLDRFNLRSVVVNWFVTYPTDRFNGVMVSDRFRQILGKKPEAANDLVDTVHPTMEFYRLKPVVRRDYREIIARLDLPDFPEMFQRLHPESNFKKSFTLANSRGFIMQDALVEDVTDALFRKEKADLYLTYFRLPDVVQHFVLGLIPDEQLTGVFYKGKEWTITEEKRDEIVGLISKVMEPVYRYMDRLLQKYMSDPRFSDAYFFVMSDHGFSLYGDGYNHYNLPGGMEAPPGILLVKGPKVKPGETTACIYDIAPSVLYLFGLPLDRHMDGKPLRDIFKLNRKVSYTDYLLDKGKKSIARKDSDKGTLEELQALGYIN